VATQLPRPRGHVGGQLVVRRLAPLSELARSVAEPLGLTQQRVVASLAYRPVAVRLLGERRDVVGEPFVRPGCDLACRGDVGTAARFVELSRDRPRIADAGPHHAQTASQDRGVRELRVEVVDAVLQQIGCGPQPGRHGLGQFRLRTQPVHQQSEDAAQRRPGIVIGTALPVGPVAHQGVPAQHHQDQVAIKHLVVGEVGGRQITQAQGPLVVASIARADRVGRHVRQEVVVLREPQVARERRRGLEPVGGQLGCELVEGPFAGRDRHAPEGNARVCGCEPSTSG
jgi:hypothetical protein